MRGARNAVPTWKRSLLPWKYASRRGIITRLVVAGVVAVVFLLPALLPTRVALLSDQYPVVEDEVHYVAGVSHSLVDVFADPEHPALAPPVIGALRTFLRSVAWKGR